MKIGGETTLVHEKECTCWRDGWWMLMAKGKMR